MFYISKSDMISSLFRLSIFCLYSLWAEIWSNEFVLTFKRICTFIMLYIFVSSLMVWNHIGFMLDDILYPEWKNVKITEPLFIIGNARSGTTWLHRVIVSMDESKFTTFRTWEIMFGVSVTWRKLFIYLYHKDEYFGSPIYQFLNHLEKRFIGEVHVHQVGLQEAEEDEWIMSHICYSQLLCLLFPLGSNIIMPLIMFDMQLNNMIKTSIFQYYHNCIKRHIYARGDSNKIFVSKNPAFTLRIDTLYKTFPDAKIICLLRDPMESIPSMISYIAQVCTLYTNTH